MVMQQCGGHERTCVVTSDNTGTCKKQGVISREVPSSGKRQRSGTYCGFVGEGLL